MAMESKASKSEGMRRYQVELIGDTPLLMSGIDLDWKEKMTQWEKSPQKEGSDVKGDDRSPAWRWIGRLYHDHGCVVMPSDNLMTMMREGGSKIPAGGRSTFARVTQSGMTVDEAFPDLLVDGRPVVVGKLLQDLEGDPCFENHQAAAAALGFELFLKSVSIEKKKHVRVRPRFDEWTVRFGLTVLDKSITDQVLEQILQYGGALCGLGDWRPSEKKAGSFGKFHAAVTRV